MKKIFISKLCNTKIRLTPMLNFSLKIYLDP